MVTEKGTPPFPPVEWPEDDDPGLVEAAVSAIVTALAPSPDEGEAEAKAYVAIPNPAPQDLVLADVQRRLAAIGGSQTVRRWGRHGVAFETPTERRSRRLATGHLRHALA